MNVKVATRLSVTVGGTVLVGESDTVRVAVAALVAECVAVDECVDVGVGVGGGVSVLVTAWVPEYEWECVIVALEAALAELLATDELVLLSVTDPNDVAEALTVDESLDVVVRVSDTTSVTLGESDFVLFKEGDDETTEDTVPDRVREGHEVRDWDGVGLSDTDCDTDSVTECPSVAEGD